MTKFTLYAFGVKLFYDGGFKENIHLSGSAFHVRSCNDRAGKVDCT